MKSTAPWNCFSKKYHYPPQTLRQECIGDSLYGVMLQQQGMLFYLCDSSYAIPKYPWCFSQRDADLLRSTDSLIIWS